MTNGRSLTDIRRRKSTVTANMAQELYMTHASQESVPQGRLLTDFSPKTIARALRIMFAKGTLPRKLLPFKLILEKYQSVDFQYDTSSAEMVEQQLQEIPLNRQGLRLIEEYDGEMCVLFYAERYLDIDYDEFVERVDVSRVGDCFRDVLGINTVVLRRDHAGRPTLQVERIAALAQPNYAAFLGKDELDVYKLEWMEYGQDEVRNWMRTICSPNGSTVADDGYLSFSRLKDSTGTKIEFVARQQFPLPRVMVALRLSRWPWYRRFLTKLAYRCFWNVTVKNLLARYDGKEVGVGRPTIHTGTSVSTSEEHYDRKS